ncbi:hypothetical protein [Desulfogranum marinum]|uniref:hypothetical protein n=1 Tax=Desulfogranum marinum TaxID=453220 RepID=UPI001963AB97|nr:hypothetical protein [Desulfogranum marinum]MBM9512069.1 hypothetical protein [Desulfogranum marinum]
MILWKIGLSALMVLGITWIAERLSPRFAGVLLGFPLGMGLSLFFIGLEQGTLFASQSALWSIQGVVAAVVFCLVYSSTAAMSATLSRLLNITLSILTSLSAYFATAFMIMQGIPSEMWLRHLLVLLTLAVTAVLFRFSASGVKKRKIRLTPLILCYRAFAAAAIILLVTGTAAIVGPRWSGLFSAFPTTILPTAVILHIHYGPTVMGPLFRELPQGMLALILFACCIHLLYPLTGVYTGIFLSYLASACYLLLYETFLRQRLNQILAKITTVPYSPLIKK